MKLLNGLGPLTPSGSVIGETDASITVLLDEEDVKRGKEGKGQKWEFRTSQAQGDLRDRLVSDHVVRSNSIWQQSPCVVDDSASCQSM